MSTASQQSAIEVTSVREVKYSKYRPAETFAIDYKVNGTQCTVCSSLVGCIKGLFSARYSHKQNTDQDLFLAVPRQLMRLVAQGYQDAKASIARQVHELDFGSWYPKLTRNEIDREKVLLSNTLEFFETCHREVDQKEVTKKAIKQLTDDFSKLLNGNKPDHQLSAESGASLASSAASPIPSCR